MLKTLAILAAALMATLALGVAAAGAAPETPNGLCGAANMTNEHALPGMLHAMSVNNANGDTGMSGAVTNSACT